LDVLVTGESFSLGLHPIFGIESKRPCAAVQTLFKRERFSPELALYKSRTSQRSPEPYHSVEMLWLYEHCSAKSSMKRSPKRNRSRRKGQNGNQKNGISNQGRVSTVVPRSAIRTHLIRRSWNQLISYSPALGFFGAGNNLQINFSAGSSNININGVGVYGPALPNSSEFSAIFDQWRIKSVTIRLDWNYNSVGPSESASSPPLFYFVTDYDDSADAAVSALLQYPGVRTHSFLSNGYTPIVYTFTPRPLKDIAGSGLLTSYGPDMSMPFIRTAELTTPHYGMKIATAPLGATSTTVIGFLLITAFVDLEFANPK